MARKTDELTIAKIKKAYLAGEGTLEALARRFGIGERTLKRYSADGNWEALKQARGAVVDEALRDRLQSVPTDFNPDALLLTAIRDLAAALPDVPVRSKESGAAAMAKLIETWRRFNPMTMDDLIDCALDIPNFEPLEFAKRLRQRMERSG
jgi:hypothetical protein